MRVHALSALPLVGLATSAAAAQLDRRQQTADMDSLACVSEIVAIAEATPTVPAELEVVTGDCIPTQLTEAAASFTSDLDAWFTGIVDAISDCPAWPSAASANPSKPSMPTFPACTGGQPSRDPTATNAVATNTNPTRPSTRSPSTAASGTESATTTSARSSAASGSAARSATTSSSQSTNAAARETGVIFAAVAMAALGAAAL